jgi:hypothetical protein
MEFGGGPGKLRAKFFKDDTTGQDMVEIKIVGDPNDIIKKVDPSHVARFAREWESYQAGATEIDVGGTPITEVPGVDRNVALALKLKGVRNAEELAGLDEAAAKGLGMGIFTMSKAAKQLVRLRELEAMQNALAEAPRRGRPPNAPKVDDIAPQI